MLNIYHSNDCLICAIRTYEKTKEERIKAIGLLLKDSTWISTQVLDDMDEIIQDFCEEMHHLYKKYAERNRDFNMYNIALEQYIENKYPWISEEAFCALYGVFSYR